SWPSASAVEMATLRWVDWYNNQRLFGPIGYIPPAEAMADRESEAGRFARRESFAYAVLTPDGKRERGCVYVYPSTVPGHDAVVRLWVTQAEYDAGFDAELYAWTQDWMARDWPFKSSADPGRATAWDT
ncbi:MAG: twin-arginine translocation pathway signal protein, partial [Erythrobacteraceae bacterium]